MKQILVFPRGQLSDANRDELLANDILAVEADDPRMVVAAIPAAPLAGAQDLFMAALKAVCTSGTGQRFADDLYTRLSEKEASQMRAQGTEGHRHG